jgi:dihydroorotate dehydrogenase (fumarate)
MVDLTTRYLGLELDNPLVPSASPLSRTLDTARRLEDAGAGALVMHSLFEEAVHHEQGMQARFMHHQSIGHAEAESFLPLPDEYLNEVDEYLEHLAALKRTLSIPVIASLNGMTLDGWVSHGRELAEAGADALELNVYYIPANLDESAVEVEARYLELLRELKASVRIPVTMKLSAQFSSPGHFIRRLQEAGADGVVLFNRFYQPDIDVETREVVPSLQLSSSAESLLRIRWLAILHGRVELSLACTGGIHVVHDAVKALMAGADVVHLCSALLAQGPEYLGHLRSDLAAWLEAHEYDSVAQIKGSVSQQHAIDPAAYERANYLDVLDSYSSAPGVRR